MPDWIKFSDRLPTQADALAGQVLTRYRSFVSGQVEERMAMWDWIPPSHPQAKELWASNGFTEWRTPR